MFKQTIIALGLCLPVLALAQAAAPAAPAASAAATAAKHVKPAPSAALARNRARGEAMGACTKQAADQKLAGVERRAFIAKCMTGQ